jgi:hypothetical protein
LDLAALAELRDIRAPMLGENDSCSAETKTGNGEGVFFVWEYICQFEKRETEAVDLVLEMKVVRPMSAVKRSCVKA